MIKEMGNKEYFLLVNKADLLNNKMRKHWSDFLIEKGVKYAFFSALFEQKKIEVIFNINVYIFYLVIRLFLNNYLNIFTILLKYIY